MSSAKAGIASPGETLPTLSGLSLRILRGSLVRVRRLRDELGALRSAYAEREDLPGLRTLVESMAIVAAGIEREVISEARQLHERLEGGANRGQAEQRFREKVGGLVIALDNVMPRFLQIARTPHGREIEALIYPVTRMVAGLFRRDLRSVELIFEGAEDYAYELSLIEELMQVASKLQPELRGQLADLPKMVAISYPQHLEAETLVHAMVAHEIAHMVIGYIPERQPSAPIVEAFDVAANSHFRRLAGSLAASRRRPRPPSWRRRARARLDPAPPGDNLMGNAREAIDRRLRKWYDEFACDALAVGMIGPAYAFALADLDLASNRWAQIRGGAGHYSHPGLAWRLQRVITQVRRDYLPEAHPDAPAWSALLTAIDQLQEVLPKEQDELLQAERDLLDEALQNFDSPDMVASVLGPAYYSSQSFEVDIEIGWEKLTKGIPPAERIHVRDEPAGAGPTTERPAWSTPMPWPSIVNSCYAYWQAGKAISDDPGTHRVLPDHPRVAQDWMDFNAFVRGTIELSNLHEQLTGQRNRLDGLNAPEEAG